MLKVLLAILHIVFVTVIDTAASLKVQFLIFVTEPAPSSSIPSQISPLFSEVNVQPSASRYAPLRNSIEAPAPRIILVPGTALR